MEEERIEDLEIYQLDFEQQNGAKRKHDNVAAGGEVLKAGDHIYLWCSVGTYQHHAIVLKADECDDDESILIAEFTNTALVGLGTDMIHLSSHGSAAVSQGVTGGFRIIEEDKPSKWHKVKYEANPIEALTWRAGTCSVAAPDSVRQILYRVQFLYQCCHLIPDYHVLASNCETVAVWCITGKYESLQGSHVMNLSTTTAPYILGTLSLPVGLAAAGMAVWHSMHIGSKWDETTNLLNKEFEWYAMGRSRPVKWENFNREKNVDQWESRTGNPVPHQENA